MVALTGGDCVAAMRSVGFTPRQARFLVLVLEHAGVCLPRQYRTFAAIAHGQQTHRFFERLIAGGSATTDLAAPAHAGRMYHLQYKPWYRLLGEPDHRHRRPMSVGRAVERLMVLDGVLADPDMTWLGLAQDKVATLTAPPFCVPPDALPQTPVAGVVRRFPDPFPIGLAPDGTWLFLYLIIDPDGRNPLWVTGGFGSLVFGGWKVITNIYTGQPHWYNDVGVEMAKGFVVGATLGLAAPVVSGVRGRGGCSGGIGDRDRYGRDRQLPSILELARELGAKSFNIPASVWEKMSEAEKKAANDKFLDRAISRGQSFIVTMDVADALKKGGVWLRHEIEYLMAMATPPGRMGAAYYRHCSDPLQNRNNLAQRCRSQYDVFSTTGSTVQGARRRRHRAVQSSLRRPVVWIVGC